MSNVDRIAIDTPDHPFVNALVILNSGEPTATALATLDTRKIFNRATQYVTEHFFKRGQFEPIAYNPDLPDVREVRRFAPAYASRRQYTNLLVEWIDRKVNPFVRFKFHQTHVVTITPTSISLNVLTHAEHITHRQHTDHIFHMLRQWSDNDLEIRWTSWNKRPLNATRHGLLITTPATRQLFGGYANPALGLTTGISSMYESFRLCASGAILLSNPASSSYMDSEAVVFPPEYAGRELVTTYADLTRQIPTPAFPGTTVTITRPTNPSDEVTHTLKEGVHEPVSKHIQSCLYYSVKGFGFGSERDRFTYDDYIDRFLAEYGPLMRATFDTVRDTHVLPTQDMPQDTYATEYPMLTTDPLKSRASALAARIASWAEGQYEWTPRQLGDIWFEPPVAVTVMLIARDYHRRTGKLMTFDAAVRTMRTLAPVNHARSQPVTPSAAETYQPSKVY